MYLDAVRGGIIAGVYYAAVLILPSESVLAQSSAGIIDASRSADWSHAGVEGGIPVRTTKCSTLNPGATGAQINQAIQSCPSGQVVYLNTGTYNITDAGLIMKSGVVLRGAGADKTIVNMGETSACAGAWTAVCFAGGDSSDWSGSSKTQPGGSNAANWTGGYAQRATQITLSNVGSAGIAVGQYIYLDQANDTATNNGLFVCESTAASPPCSVEGGNGNPGRSIGGIARQQLQMVKVTGINAGTYTISPGLYAPNWSSGKSPGAWWPSSTIQNAGLEDLTLDASTAGGNSNIALFNAMNVWIKGTRQIRNCACQRSIIATAPAAHATIQDNYFYGTSGHSQNYGIESYLSSDNLIVNNIFQHVVAPLMIHSNTGSVYAYNYAINDTYDDGRTPIYHWMTAGLTLHSGGVMYNLFEGNIGPGISADYIHGNQVANTAFRNYFLGSDPGRIDSTYAVNLMAWNRYWNVIGNVLGTPGYTLRYVGSNPAIYSLGGGYSPVPDDPMVASTLMRWGNYDVVNAAVKWDSTEVPSGIGSFANPLPASHSLPPSFFYPAKPGWWPAAKPWPPIGPEVTGGNITGCGGHANTIPAEDCYRNVMHGPIDGSGNALTFNAGTCYTTASTSNPASPTNLRISP